MIIKSHEFKTNKSSGNIHLFYGNNEGLKKDLISQNFTNKFEGSIFKYEEREIINYNIIYILGALIVNNSYV